ncbi:hypothetical protein DCS_03265 [Drechmeria coniospora]|uniref:Uncharacterized protein n=1 Tax=Drechmeria coniospora TaxID=98403 RepID=A0A151GYD0_DRECN|nr:hypothetical protein DCS_03265 [Drechmeria coniospora]KYK62118.1 hypothetical protein DCS_03265 [Drechmeria coniospora]
MDDSKVTDGSRSVMSDEIDYHPARRHPEQRHTATRSAARLLPPQVCIGSLRALEGAGDELLAMAVPGVICHPSSNPITSASFHLVLQSHDASSSIITRIPSETIPSETPVRDERYSTPTRRTDG